MPLFDVFATRDERPSKPGEHCTLKLVCPPIEAADGDEAITLGLAAANLADLKLGGLVAVEREGFTLKEVTVVVTDPANRPGEAIGPRPALSEPGA